MLFVHPALKVGGVESSPVDILNNLNSDRFEKMLVLYVVDFDDVQIGEKDTAIPSVGVPGGSNLVMQEDLSRLNAG